LNESWLALNAFRVELHNGPAALADPSPTQTVVVAQACGKLTANIANGLARITAICPALNRAINAAAITAA